jgi:hypothetical protein
LKLASRDEHLRQLMLRFVVDNFKEELKKMLGPATFDDKADVGEGLRGVPDDEEEEEESLGP